MISMKRTELIAKLKKCPEEAEVFFDDSNGGLIDVEQCEVISADKARQRGREIKTSAVILSDRREIE